MTRTQQHIISLAVLLMVGLPAWAQPRLLTPEMYIGVHGGVLASMMQWEPKVRGTEHVLQTALLSGNGGLVFRYSRHKCCGLQVELNYMQRGWREQVSSDVTGVSGSYTRRLNYIELPFLMHIYFGKKNWRGFVNAGPQIGYCFKESHSGVQDPTDTVQYQKLTHPFDWGIGGGLGFYYRAPRVGVFQLEARFNYSLGNCFANGRSDYFSKSHAMNLSLNLAYLWQLSPKTSQRNKPHKHPQP